MKNIFKNYTHKTLTILLVFISLNAYSQYKLDWEQNYGGSNSDYLIDIKQTSDGGFIAAGVTNSNDIDVSQKYGGSDAWVVKTDADGNLLWEKNYGGTNGDVFSTVDQTLDGGYIFLGSSHSSDIDVGANNGDQDFWLVKTDALGNITWEQNFGGSDYEHPYACTQTFDGGYLITGSTQSSDGDVGTNYGLADYWLVKTDSLGNLLWEQNYGGSEVDIPSEIIQTTDSNYIVIGTSYSSNGDITGNNGQDDAWIIKINQSGNIIWESSYGYSGYDAGNSIIETSIGYTFAGVVTFSSNNQFWIVNLDFSGNILSENFYGGSGQDLAKDIYQTSNGGFIVSGTSFSNDGDVSGNYGIQDFWIIQTDSQGNLIWEQNYGGSDVDFYNALSPLAGGGFIVGGSTKTNDFDISSNNGDADYWIFKLNPLLADVYGNIYLETNNNCIFDSGDSTYSNIIAQAQNILLNNTYYGNTNTNGQFHIDLDTTNYEISIANFSPYWEISACSQDSQTINLNSSNTSDTLDFFFAPSALCPYLEVDISTPLLRRCFTNSYNISYCNNGSAIANNAYVEIEIDPTLVVNSSTIPWTTVVGNVYTFPIGNINIFDCGNFSIEVSVPCDSTSFLGQILCTEANIFPNTLCLPATNTWNGAELEASAKCIGTDTIEFSLKNIGIGNMGGDVPIIVIEDVFLIMDSLDQLNAGDEIKWRFPTNGLSTHRMIAQQPSDHPFKTFTTDAAANCNLMASVGPPPIQNTSFLSYPNDEESPFEAVDCQPVIGAYDPNDKTVYPSGVGPNHFITETTDLEYKIRFQNTGTDTAFTVVIRDSISNLLDLSTFTAGASSHSYTYNIYGTGVIDFTFNNVLLPDSFIDEPASHGFVQYKIKQQNTNTTGDIILNNADIFFDFNDPVRTNTVFSEIGGIILDTIIYKFPSEEIPNGITDLNKFNIKIYPNPASDFITFELDKPLKDISIELFNIEGKMQQKSVGINANKLTIQRAHLARGMYLFKIYSNEKEIAYGKLIFE